ncbi:hypothetical protein FVE85_5834 [Porphyridium purpureum]|uniref:Nuclease associated modular domain-containing protein n=1 Tax=Porphyridium purpureum TaxID=35688 RepID=A0A5J4Z2S3_PORPP|nr:hypothetical protein FVE85_5834 [Porphyridium purpureum]|eukprot:POR2400..scf295_1
MNFGSDKSLDGSRNARLDMAFIPNGCLALRQGHFLFEVALMFPTRTRQTCSLDVVGSTRSVAAVEAGDQSDGRKEKRSNAQRVFSEGHREKISIGLRRYHAQRRAKMGDTDETIARAAGNTIAHDASATFPASTVDVELRHDRVYLKSEPERRQTRLSSHSKPKKQAKPRRAAMSEETRRKISHRVQQYYLENPDARDQRRRNKTGALNPMFNRRHSAAARAKMQAQKRGSKNPNYGKQLDAQHRERISAAMRLAWERRQASTSTSKQATMDERLEQYKRRTRVQNRQIEAMVTQNSGTQKGVVQVKPRLSPTEQRSRGASRSAKHSALAQTLPKFVVSLSPDSHDRTKEDVSEPHRRLALLLEQIRSN